MKSAPSVPVPPEEVSKRSVMPAAGVNVAVLFMPKKPTTRSLAAVVVTDVAVTDDAFALLTFPLDVSIGLALLTPT